MTSETKWFLELKDNACDIYGVRLSRAGEFYECAPILDKGPTLKVGHQIIPRENVQYASVVMNGNGIVIVSRRGGDR